MLNIFFLKENIHKKTTLKTNLQKAHQNYVLLKSVFPVSPLSLWRRGTNANQVFFCSFLAYFSKLFYSKHLRFLIYVNFWTWQKINVKKPKKLSYQKRCKNEKKHVFRPFFYLLTVKILQIIKQKQSSFEIFEVISNFFSKNKYKRIKSKAEGFYPPVYQYVYIIFAWTPLTILWQCCTTGTAAVCTRPKQINPERQ